MGKIFFIDDIKNWGRNNIWNILGTGFAAAIVIIGAMNFFVTKIYSISCAEFYGADKRYFSGTTIFDDRINFLVLTIIVAVSPFIFAYISKKSKSKIFVILMFFATLIVLFTQNLVYTSSLIETIQWNWLKQVIDNMVLLVIFIVVDIFLAYLIIIRKFFCEKKEYGKIEKIILGISMIIYLLDVGLGWVTTLNYGIEDKKTYEIIENNEAIIADYNGDFVVMNCEVQGNTLILKKSEYRLKAMTEGMVTYHKYERVICE